MPSFQRPHIIKTKRMFIQYLNLTILFTPLLQFHFVTTCYSSRTMYVQFVCWYTWGNIYLNFLLLICIYMKYLWNLLVTRSWYIVCAFFLEIAFWYDLLFHIIPTPAFNKIVNLCLNLILLICTSIANSLNLYNTSSLYFVCEGYLAEISYWYELLWHIIPTPPSNGVVNFY